MDERKDQGCILIVMIIGALMAAIGIYLAFTADLQRDTDLTFPNPTTVYESTK